MICQIGDLYILWYITLYVVRATHMYFKWDWVNPVLICMYVTCMHRIKPPQQDFVLKMQGGLCTRGGVFAGHYGNKHFHSDTLHVGGTWASTVQLSYWLQKAAGILWFSELDSSTVFCMCSSIVLSQQKTTDLIPVSDIRVHAWFLCCSLWKILN